MKYIYATVFIAALLLIGSSIYEEATKKGAKAARLTCQKGSVVFERIVDQELLEKLQNRVKSGADVSFELHAQKSKYMPTKFFDIYDIEMLKEATLQAMKPYETQAQKDGNKSIVIDILVYENDKEDPGKKSAEAKVYAGYLVYSFIIEQKTVYKIQIDFMESDGSDINTKVACAVESLMSL